MKKATAITIAGIITAFLFAVAVTEASAEDWSLQDDKKLHLGLMVPVGMGANGLMHIGGNYMDQPSKKARAWGTAIMCTIPIGLKEAADATGAGDASWADVGYGYLGCGIGYFIGEATFKNYDGDKEEWEKLQEQRRLNGWTSILPSYDGETASLAIVMVY